ncbi:MAG TPA: hypothetical protein DHV28_19365 [Ignavibacteriales bacterium]|nr:hypothetical protein [Ignavibacteriales bacterium]
MARKNVRKEVDKVKSKDYLRVAESFVGGAEAARSFEYWNAAGVLIVHAAIAYADAICIKYGGVKSQGEDHSQVVTLLREVLSVSDDNKKAYIQLEKIIAHKTSVSYSGDVYDEKDVDNLWKNFERFKRWVEIILRD